MYKRLLAILLVTVFVGVGFAGCKKSADARSDMAGFYDNIYKKYYIGGSNAGATADSEGLFGENGINLRVAADLLSVIGELTPAVYSSFATVPASTAKEFSDVAVARLANGQNVEGAVYIRLFDNLYIDDTLHSLTGDATGARWWRAVYNRDGILTFYMVTAYRGISGGAQDSNWDAEIIQNDFDTVQNYYNATNFFVPQNATAWGNQPTTNAYNPSTTNTAYKASVYEICTNGVQNDNTFVVGQQRAGLWQMSPFDRGSDNRNWSRLRSYGGTENKYFLVGDGNYNTENGSYSQSGSVNNSSPGGTSALRPAVNLSISKLVTAIATQAADDIDGLNDDINDLNDEIDRLGGVIEGLNDDIRDLEEERDGLTRDLDELQGKHDKLEDDIADLEDERDELQRQYDALDDDHADLKEELKTKIKQKQDEIDAKETEIETLNGKISQKQTEINQKNEHIGELQSQVAVLTAERDKARESEIDLIAQLTEIHLLRAALEDENARLNAEIERLKNAKPPKPNPAFLIVGIVALVIGLLALGGGATLFIISRKKTVAR